MNADLSALIVCFGDSNKGVINSLAVHYDGVSKKLVAPEFLENDEEWDTEYYYFIAVLIVRTLMYDVLIIAINKTKDFAGKESVFKIARKAETYLIPVVIAAKSLQIDDQLSHVIPFSLPDKKDSIEQAWKRLKHTRPRN